MPIRVIWDNDDRKVVRHIFEGVWTWDEFDLCVLESKALMESVEHKVHMILDVQNSQGLPQGFLSHMRTVTQKPHDNAGSVVLVGASSFIQAFTNLFLKFYSANERPFMMVGTLDEARDWLATRAQS